MFPCAECDDKDCRFRTVHQLDSFTEDSPLVGQLFSYIDHKGAGVWGICAYISLKQYESTLEYPFIWALWENDLEEAIAEYESLYESNYLPCKLPPGDRRRPWFMPLNELTLSQRVY